MKKINNKKDILFIISIIGIMFIPILYAGFFIGAFEDPYNNLDNVDVAIVNEDLEIECNGEILNVGSDIVDTIKESDKFSWNFVTNEEALEGMENNDYYFTVKIPEDFSENICSTLNNDPQDASITYMKNDNNNYIVGLLGTSLISELESGINETISSNFLQSLSVSLSETDTLKDGTASILDGSNEIEDGVNDLKAGVYELNTSAQSLSDGTSDLSDGTSDLNSSYATFDDGLSDVSTNLSSINEGYDNLNTSMTSYLTLLEASINSSDLDEDSKTLLLETYQTIIGTQTYLNTSLSSVNSGVTSLDSNSSLIKTSISDLNSGASSLDSYMSALVSGTSELYSGTVTLADGVSDLSDGAEELDSGVEELITSLDELNIEENSENISSSVTTVEDNYSEVENYGYGFTPYFVSLGLFVGGITSTIVIGARNPDKKKTKKDIIRRVKLYSLVSIMQALVLNLFLLALQINIDNALLFVLFTILMSISFMSIIQLFTVTLGDIGKFISIIILILQLTSSGGTFPVETSSAFFQGLNNFMPMTYTVDALRAIIGNGNMSIVYNASLVLIGIIIATSSILFIYFKKIKTQD